MTKIAFALGLVNHLRRQKTPPYARICCLLSLAENARRMMTARQIFHRFGMKEPSAGTLECAIRQGLIEEIPAKPATLYRITPEGEAIVTALLTAGSEVAGTTCPRSPSS